MGDRKPPHNPRPRSIEIADEGEGVLGRRDTPPEINGSGLTVGGTTGVSTTDTDVNGTVWSPVAFSIAVSTACCHDRASSNAPLLDAHASASKAELRAFIANLLASEVSCRRGSGGEGVCLPDRGPEKGSGVQMPGRPVPH